MSPVIFVCTLPTQNDHVRKQIHFPPFRRNYYLFTRTSIQSPQWIQIPILPKLSTIHNLCTQIPSLSDSSTALIGPGNLRASLSGKKRWCRIISVTLPIMPFSPFFWLEIFVRCSKMFICGFNICVGDSRYRSSWYVGLAIGICQFRFWYSFALPIFCIICCWFLLVMLGLWASGCFVFELCVVGCSWKLLVICWLC